MLSAGAAARFGLQVAERGKKAVTLDPQQPRADQHDQAVADDLDDAHRVAHELGGRAEQHRGDADDRHGGQRLHHRRGERQRDAAAPGLLVGEQIGGNHRLAVAGSGGMENAVDERNSHQAPERGAVALGGADHAGQLAIEHRLPGEHPAGDAADLRSRTAERTELRPCRVGADASAKRPSTSPAIG